MRLRHFEALRVELNELFTSHQATCTSANCRMDEIYGDVVSVLQDEFYTLAPLIAGRNITESMTREEVDQLFLVKEEVLGAIQAGQEATYELLDEKLDLILNKTPYGKADWSLLAYGVLTKLAAEKLVDRAILEPMFKEIERSIS